MVILWGALGGVVLLGCVGVGHGALGEQVLRGELAAAVKTYQTDFRDDEPAREDLAVAVLMQAARSEDTQERREAFMQLSSLGVRAVDWLQDLVEEPGPRATKVMALGLLADMGDVAAVGTLRELSHDLDPELLPIAIAHLDAKTDRARLLGYVTADDASTRRAACKALRALEGDREVIVALSERLRLDPDASVRARSLSSLAEVGGRTQPAIREALADDNQRVRFAALELQLEVQDERALEQVDQLLRGDASELAVEAARWVILNHMQIMVGAAKGLLERALSAPLIATRSQAVVALRGLPASLLEEATRARLEQEGDASVRLQLALRHMPSDAARKVLVDLESSASKSVALEAAVELAAVGDKESLDKVLAARADEHASLRARASRALAQNLHQSEAVIELLADNNVAVRCATARALLAGESAERT